MGKIAFLFSGQGAQYPGMGKPFYENYSVVTALYDMAENKRPGTINQSFYSDADTLKKTENTQPCLFLADMAAAVALEENGVKADGVAGFSLGEIAALTYADAFVNVSGFEVVCRRAELMGEANAEADAGMVAVVKMENKDVEAIAAEFAHLYPVNYNCPGQLVVAGDRQELMEFTGKIKAKGGRAVPLAVSGAFHSPYMDRAAMEFGEYLKGVVTQQSSVPVYANSTAKPYGADVCATLMQQMNHPVLWEQTIRTMYADGFDTFIETGVGDTLVKLVKKTLPECTAFAVNDLESLALVKAVCHG